MRPVKIFLWSNFPKKSDSGDFPKTVKIEKIQKIDFQRKCPQYHSRPFWGKLDVKWARGATYKRENWQSQSHGAPRGDQTDFFKTQIFDISAYPEHAKNYVWYNFECDQIFADPAGQYLKKISIFRPPQKKFKKGEN